MSGNSIMSMFNGMFGSQPQQQAQVAGNPGAGQPGNIPPQAGATDNSNSTLPPGTVAAANQNTGTPESGASNNQAAAPLAEFADLWKPVTTEGAAQDTSFLGNVDPAKVMEAASKTNFSQVLSQDALAKITQGGPEAVAAFADAMNKVAQNVYAQSAIATTKIVEQGLAKAQGKFSADLPQQIKRHTVTDNLRQDNPAFNNPAVAPLISAMEQQFTLKYPNSSASEITAMAKNYVAGVGGLFAPQQQTQTPQQKQASAGEDWSSWI